MEPVTFVIIGFVMWLLNAYGKDVVSIAKDKIQNWYRYAVNNRNILILGPRQSGKTSLILFLQTNRPFTLKDGKRVEPEPTGAAAIIDRAVNLNKRNQRKKEIVNIRKDVGGDKVFSDLWKELIEDIDPEGIIYMVDGSNPEKQLKEDIDRLFSDVLIKYEDQKRKLVALHVFINFSDIWEKGDRQIRIKKENLIRFVIETELKNRKFRKLADLNFDVYSIHLSPTKNHWRKAEAALHRFAADLNATD
jgi:GTPase SAR1 family protein